MQLTVGQKVIVTRPCNRGTEVVERTVSKIGRKWITVKGEWTEERFDLDGEGESTTGWRSRLWPDMATYEAHVHLVQRWAVLSGLFRQHGRPPEHITVDQIETMIGLMTPPSHHHR